MQKVFLTAHWGNLLLLNYAVRPALLAPYLPKGCELDLYEGSAYLSLVAFQFTKTRVFGFQWPGFRDFPELNLRFYVKRNGKRGVSFIKEFVPSALVAGMARALYNEPYSKARMTEKVVKTEREVQVDYALEYKGHSLRFMAQARNEPFLPAENSVEHFFKEHELGVGREKSGEVVTYEVEHPLWRVFPILNTKIEMDAGGIYGNDFAFLSQQKPSSVVLAEGSPIIVYKKNSRSLF